MIVSTCSQRILSRLGYLISKHGKRKKRVDKLLLQIVQLIGSKFEDLGKDSLQVITLAQSWASKSTDTNLKNLVDGVARLSRIPDLSGKLATIQNSSMDPSDRKSLLRMVNKVTRYHDAALFLYRAAKKDVLVQNLRTTLVQLPAEAFHQNCTSYVPDFWKACEKIGIASKMRENIPKIQRVLQISVQGLEPLFVNRCKETMKNGRIHAEMQLVYHLETLETTTKPRVIASSKMACFLCNAFLCEVSKIHIRKSHGRLYPGWKIPLFPRNSDLADRFLRYLQNCVRGSLNTLVQSKKRTIYTQPSESALWTMQNSNTTIKPVPRHQQTVVAGDELVLQQGVGVRIRPQPSGTATVLAGSISLFIEYSMTPNRLHLRPLCYLEWLSEADASAVRAAKPLSVRDAETLHTELTVPKSQHGEMYLAIKDCVLMVSIA